MSASQPAFVNFKMATSKGSGACRTIVQLRLTDSAAASVSDEHKSTSLEADIEKKVDKARLELKEAQNALDNAKSELKDANAELKAAKTESEINRANQAVDRANEGVDTSQSLVTSCTKRVVELMQRLTRLESAASGTSLYYFWIDDDLKVVSPAGFDSPSSPSSSSGKCSVMLNES